MEPERLGKLRIERKEPVQGAASEQPRRRLKWKMILPAVLLIIAGFVFLQLYRNGVLTPSIPVRSTSTAKVHASQVLAEFNASGYVVAQRRASVASKGTGRLVYLGVREGSKVKKGDVIAQLENEDLKAEHAQIQAQLNVSRAQLNQAEVELVTAEKNWVRYKRLLELKAVSQLDHEAAADRYQKALAAVTSARAAIRAQEANLHRAEVLIEYTVIRAPFDGVILTKDADVGEVVAPFGSATNAKAAVVTMADPASVMVQADVAEASLPKVHIGQPCVIQLDSMPDERFPGRVDTIVPTADRTKGTVMVKVRFDSLEPRILPEMSARVTFLSRPIAEHEEQPFLGVHKDALAKKNDREGIFKIENGRAEWVPLTDVKYFGDYIVLGPPFQGGEQIVVEPPEKLEDGARVKTAE